MNGRAYDYNLGRFLSVDPIIQAPGNSQSMNPYSYIMNNPLSGTDPSGYTAECNSEGTCDIGSIKLKDVDSVSITKDGNAVVNTSDGSSYKIETHNGKSVEGSFKGAYQTLSKGIEQIGAQGNTPNIADSTNTTGGGASGPLAAGALAGKKAVEFGAQAAANQSPYLKSIETGARAQASRSTTNVVLGVLGRIIGGALTMGLWSESAHAPDMEMDFDLSNVNDAPSTLTKLRSSSDGDEQSRKAVYFHYTNEKGFNAIMSSSAVKIVPGPDGNVYLTTQPMTPEYANQALFMGRRRNGATHVIALTLQAGVPLTPGTQRNELLHKGTLRQGRQIENILYSGENQF